MPEPTAGDIAGNPLEEPPEGGRREAPPSGTGAQLVKTVLIIAGKVSAGATLVAAAAKWGGPTLGGLAFLVLAIIGALCWILEDGDRTRRLSQLIRATRGEPNRRSPSKASKRDSADDG